MPPGWIEQRRVPRRLRRGAGGAGAAVHLRRLSRHGDAGRPERLARRADLPVAIYLPSFLLLIGVLPFWDALRRRTAVQSALTGVNAAVVGLLLAALYTPVWTSAIFAGRFRARRRRVPAAGVLGVPPWLVVLFGAVGATIIANISWLAVPT